MKREEDPELWDLLGQGGTPPELSPFFARNVARQVRQRSGWRDNLWRWLRPGRLIPAGAVALALIVTTMSVRLPGRQADPADDVPETVSIVDPQDYEVVADLDDLLASDDDGVWDDTDTLSL